MPAITYPQTIIKAEVLRPFLLKLSFADGFVGEIDVSPILQRGGVFTPLSDPRIFSEVRVEYGTVVWPGDVDLSPESLRAYCEAGRVITLSE